MQEHLYTNAALEAPRFRERRKNLRKRGVVANGVIAGQANVVSGVEYLQSRGIEADIIKRVLLALLARRLASQERREELPALLR